MSLARLKIAGAISPIEAIRYTENDAGAFQTKKRLAVKKSTGGTKIHRMALANLGRNRKRTVLVIVSMTLSLVLFNTVFTLSSGFDIDKYVETTRAKWVTEGGIDEEWDAYIEQLNTMGLDQLVQIYTDAYERYTAE